MTRRHFWSGKRRDPVERFWAFVDKFAPSRRPELGPCWVWTGAKNGSRGYGTFGLNWRRPMYAHRYSWQLATGEAPPPGMLVCHHCDNPSCVNPTHLFLGTDADNMADMDAKGRRRCKPMPGSANPRAVLTDEQVASIRARYLAGGVSQEALAREYGTSRSAVGNAVRGVTWATNYERPPGKFYRRGSGATQSKLDETTVRGILVTCGSCKTVAAAFGVTAGLINQIRLGKIWKHVRC